MVSFSFEVNNGTSIAKYQRTIGTDTIIKDGQSKNVKTKLHCITAMEEYEGKSLEELRLEDYLANRKGPQAGATEGFGFGATPQPAGGTGLFGSILRPSMFGQAAVGTTENKSMFGSTSNAFGQIAATGFEFTATQPFRSTGTTGFGATESCTSFGAKPVFGLTVEQTTKNCPVNGTGLFGATNRPSALDAGTTNNKDLVYSTISMFGKPATTGFETTTTQSFGPTGTNDLAATSTDVSNSIENKKKLFFGQKMDTSVPSAFGPTTCSDVGSGTTAGQQQQKASTANTRFGAIPSYIVYLFVFLILLSFFSFMLNLFSILSL